MATDFTTVLDPWQAQRARGVGTMFANNQEEANYDYDMADRAFKAAVANGENPNTAYWKTIGAVRMKWAGATPPPEKVTGNPRTGTVVFNEATGQSRVGIPAPPRMARAKYDSETGNTTYEYELPANQVPRGEGAGGIKAPAGISVEPMEAANERVMGIPQMSLAQANFRPASTYEDLQNAPSFSERPSGAVPSPLSGFSYLGGKEGLKAATEKFLADKAARIGQAGNGFSVEPGSVAAGLMGAPTWSFSPPQETTAAEVPAGVVESPTDESYAPDPFAPVTWSSLGRFFQRLYPDAATRGY